MSESNTSEIAKTASTLPKREENQEIFWKNMVQQKMRAPHLSTQDRIQISRDRTADQALKNRERDRAERDALTGLLNRKGYDRRLKEEVARARRSGQELSVIFMDLNNLHDINKEEGHAGGDKKIKAAAESLKRVSRETDVLARIGGDEYVALLPNTQKEQAMSYWDRLFPELALSDVKISAGIGKVTPGTQDEVEGSIRLADAAMYKAKLASRDVTTSVMKTVDDLSDEEKINSENLIAEATKRIA